MKKSLTFLLLFIFLFSACSPQANSEFTSNHEKWQVADIHHYHFSLSVSCFCAFSQKMPLSIEILDGKVVTMKYSDGSPVPEKERQTFAKYQTIDLLFNYTQTSIKKADEVHVLYDPTYGYPSQVQIDFIKNAVDDELSLSVQSFEPLQ